MTAEKKRNIIILITLDTHVYYYYLGNVKYNEIYTHKEQVYYDVEILY